MNSFDENFDKLENWMAKYNELTSQVPDITRIYEIAKVGKEIIDSSPNVNSTLYNNIYQNYNDGLSALVHYLPPIGPISPILIQDSMISASSGATGSFYNIQTFVPNSKSENDWKYKSIGQYNDYLEKHKFITEIIAFFEECGSKDSKEMLLELTDEFQKYTNGAHDHVAFGFKIRNFIEHVKGILKKAADINKFSKETDKEYSWPKMASEIVKPTKGNRAYKEFISMGNIWIELHEFLSDKSKKFNGNDYENYCSSYNTCIFMVNTFTIIVDIEKIKRIFS
jgi:hypothetical protein